MSDVSALKKQLRKQLGKRRDELSDRSRRSERIIQRVLEMQAIRDATLVCCFVSFRSEVRTHVLLNELWTSGKQICVPWCNGDVLGLCRIDSLDELQPRTMGILEPARALRDVAERRIEIAESQVVIVPGLAFTETGARLGYGKGHYDRMLSSAAETLRVAVAFECQIEPELPTDHYDMPMHFVATEERLIHCATSS